MQNRAKTISSPLDKVIQISVIPGHFATNHSHVNHYIDFTRIKTHHSVARAAAKALAQHYADTTVIDTIICLEETEVVGAYLAEELAKEGPIAVNAGKDIGIISPELNANNQMIFRENTQSLVFGKNILLFIASISTGKTLNRLVECLEYYNGTLAGVAAFFSVVPGKRGVPVHALFTGREVEGYQTYLHSNCPLCNSGQKLDAIVSSAGYVRL